MQAHTNEELWRVQLGTGEIRLMTLDALDHAFNEGHIDARVPVLPPGASSWTTLGEAAGLEDDVPRSMDTPSLSPVAISGPRSVAPPALGSEPGSALDLDLPDTFDELRPRRRSRIFGGVAAAGAAAVMLAVVAARLGSSMPTTSDVKAAAVQAPPAAVETIPTKAEAKEEAKAVETGGNQGLSDWQKRMLLDADKARETKARARSSGKATRAPAARPAKPKSGGLLNGGDRFDPLNGAL
jgi:hypothetical protein